MDNSDGNVFEMYAIT